MSGRSTGKTHKHRMNYSSTRILHANGCRWSQIWSHFDLGGCLVEFTVNLCKMRTLMGAVKEHVQPRIYDQKRPVMKMVLTEITCREEGNTHYLLLNRHTPQKCVNACGYNISRHTRWYINCFTVKDKSKFKGRIKPINTNRCHGYK